MRSATLAGWIGAAAMAAAPFAIDSDAGKCLAIFGLFLLTIQALEKSLINLVLINGVSIVGYTYAIFY
jgi:hypothetical protein